MHAQPILPRRYIQHIGLFAKNIFCPSTPFSQYNISFAKLFRETFTNFKTNPVDIKLLDSQSLLDCTSSSLLLRNNTDDLYAFRPLFSLFDTDPHCRSITVRFCNTTWSPSDVSMISPSLTLVSQQLGFQSQQLLINICNISHTKLGLIIVGRTGNELFSEDEYHLLDFIGTAFGDHLWTIILEHSGSKSPQRLDPPPEASPMARHTFLQLVDKLTPAQRTVLPHLLQGKTEIEIGKLIFRSRYTVHDHARAIYSVFKVQSRVELVLLFSKHSLQPHIADYAQSSRVVSALCPIAPTLS